MKLSEIQKALKAPKTRKNSFSNYMYRNCEDILDAVKPLLNGSMLTLADDVVQIGNRYYIKATATYREATGETVSVSAFAREPESKKGMDEPQITGTASSYARKYALNGLFCIDDNKDPDECDNTECGQPVKPKPLAVKPVKAKPVSQQDDHDPTVWAKVIEIIDSGLSENAYINYAKVAKKTHEKAGKWVAADSDPQKWAKWIVGQDWYKELLNKIDEDDASVLDAMNMNPL